MIIKVDRKCIDAGVQHDCKTCPVALAVNRHLRIGYYTNVFADFLEIRNADKSSVLEIMLTTNVWQFIKNFDAGHSVKPLQFELKITVIQRNMYFRD